MAGVTDVEDPLVQEFHQAAVDADLSATIGVFNAACDIGFYRNLMGVPAINFGVGENAHSMHESIKGKRRTQAFPRCDELPCHPRQAVSVSISKPGRMPRRPIHIT
ncbi:MAG: hypothetical protein ACLUI3_08235 [Christensenellales bacterium]